MTPDAAARVHALIAHWRMNAIVRVRPVEQEWWERQCADQLDAALAAALAPPNDELVAELNIDAQVDRFVTRLELLLHRKTGNTWQAPQLRAVRALFHEALAAAALAPNPAPEKEK